MKILRHMQPVKRLRKTGARATANRENAPAHTDYSQSVPTGGHRSRNGPGIRHDVIGFIRDKHCLIRLAAQGEDPLPQHSRTQPAAGGGHACQ